jgi:hypothetical protein
MSIAAENRALFERLAETGVQVRVGDALMRLRPSIEVLLDRAKGAGAVRDDLLPEELIVLLGALCQEAVAADWSERLRKRALGVLFDGMRQTIERIRPQGNRSRSSLTHSNATALPG